MKKDNNPKPITLSDYLKLLKEHNDFLQECLLKKVQPKKQLPVIIENTEKFDSEYPIECRKKNTSKYLFMKPGQLKDLKRMHLN